MDETPAPPRVAALRPTFETLRTEAPALLDAAERRAATWRWASSLSDPGPLPLSSERFAGAPVRWLAAPPDTPADEYEVGCDEEGRVVVVRARSPQRPDFRWANVWRHGEGEIRGLRVDGVLRLEEVSRVELDARGVPAAYASLRHDGSWIVETYRHDEEGRLATAEAHVWIRELGGAPLRSTYEARYDGLGALAEILEHADGEVTIAYRARRRSKRALRDALAEWVRAELLAALPALRDPAGVTALCLQYERGEPLPPWLTVLRDDRLARPDATLDDFTPQEWRVADGDGRALGARGSGALAELGALGDDAPDLARAVLRQVVKATAAGDLQTVLGSAAPPLLYAMDLEREDAAVNLRDALGAARARAVLRGPGIGRG